MTPEEIASKAAADAAAQAEKDASAAGAKKAPSQDLIGKELDDVRKKGEGKTRLEKARFRRQELDREIASLEGETDAAIVPEGNDDAPVTVGMLKKLKEDEAAKTALTLAEDIADERERELTKHHLSHTIKPSGNAQQDLRNAQAIVNTLKNKQIIEEAARRGTGKTAPGGSGAPAIGEADIFEPTAEEMSFMRPPYNLTKEDIIKARG